MSYSKLLPGDRVIFEQNGRNLKGVVADALMMKSKGEPLMIPVIRPAIRKRPRIKADKADKADNQKLRWLPRKSLRKLPN